MFQSEQKAAMQQTSWTGGLPQPNRVPQGYAIPLTLIGPHLHSTFSHLSVREAYASCLLFLPSLSMREILKAFTFLATQEGREKPRAFQ